ncbi:MAG: hypothetical protein JWL81_1758, partial [Verrucomicrobiales bacterium]|nr:hypothetical protein [Verrucomicrobiales bacterium]
PVITTPGNALIADFLPDEVAGRVLLAFGTGVFAASPDTGKISPLNQLSPDDQPEGAQTVRRISLKPDGGVLALMDTAEADETGALHQKPRSNARAIAALTAARHAALLAGGRLEIRTDSRTAPPDDLPSRAFVNGGEGRVAAWSSDSKHFAAQAWDRVSLDIGEPWSGGNPDAIATRNTGRSLEWMLLPMWHPDGSLITVLENRPVVLRQTSAAPSTWPVSPLPLPAGTWSATVLAGGSQVAFATPAGVSFLDWNTRTVLREIPVTGAPFHLFTHGDDATVFALGTDLRLHRLGAEPCTVPLADSVPPAVAWPAPLAWHSGKSLLALRLRGRTQLLHLSATGPLITPGHSLPADSTLTALAFSPDGRRLATANSRRELILWDWEESLPLLQFPIRATASSIAFSPDGRWLANTDFAPSLELREAPPPAATSLTGRAP